MRLSSLCSRSGFLAVAVASLVLGPASRAQSGSANAPAQPQQQQPGKPAAQNAPAQPQEVAKKDPEEEKAYAAFNATNGRDADKVIQLGEQFLQKYPNSSYAEVTYSRLTQAYFNKGQDDKMYASADKALALNPDDVSVLSLVGWVIPHSYNPNDIEAERRLNRAETYEKHALEVLPAMPTPPNLTDAQFASAKLDAASRAHSGLGLIYYWRQQFPDSVRELQEALQDEGASPDATDLYVMGVGLQTTKRFGEAADAFQKCAQIASGLQDRCKQGAETARKQAASQPKN